MNLLFFSYILTYRHNIYVNGAAMGAFLFASTSLYTRLRLNCDRQLTAIIPGALKRYCEREISKCVCVFYLVTALRWGSWGPVLAQLRWCPGRWRHTSWSLRRCWPGWPEPEQHRRNIRINWHAAMLQYVMVWWTLEKELKGCAFLPFCRRWWAWRPRSPDELWLLLQHPGSWQVCRRGAWWCPWWPWPDPHR